MSESISVTLTGDLAAQVDAIASADGMSRAELIQRAVESYVFSRRIRLLRREAMRQLAARGIRLTDEDVFRLVS